ncbi:hypothetical protein, conserved [Eimeria maxima]|uniref:Uncharacterized protein n=1 Tax=Eimeria maxima TaxID=5804 RepID=U6MF68_EIMMA|nr:hypothetical protein, conserved [Eimeria maxima]CDJ60310.1 hypothetical protein, conserved [Eimeria maxima]
MRICAPFFSIEPTSFLARNQFGMPAEQWGVRRPDPPSRTLKANRGDATFSQLMWTRGQSKIPHPAEAINADGTYSIAIRHGNIAPRNYTRPHSHLPSAEAMCRTMLKLSSLLPSYVSISKACAETKGVMRTTGADALNRVREGVHCLRQS